MIKSPSRLYSSKCTHTPVSSNMAFYLTKDLQVSSFKFQVSILLDSLVSRQGMYKNTKNIYTMVNSKHEKYSY